MQQVTSLVHMQLYAQALSPGYPTVMTQIQLHKDLITHPHTSTVVLATVALAAMVAATLQVTACVGVQSLGVRLGAVKANHQPMG